MVSLSPNNKIGKYIKFNKNDKFLKECIDYIGFYGDWNINLYHARLGSFLSSDNGQSSYIGPIEITKTNIGKSLSWSAHYSHMGFVVNLLRIMQLKIAGKNVLKIDLYGKGLLVINRDNLRPQILGLLSIFGMNNIILSRTDYAVDCEKINFRKINSLKTRISGTIKSKDGIEYLCYGRKGKSANFIRYYNKKLELQQRGSFGLYPEYMFIPTIMRYELQISSDGFDKNERILTIQDLPNYANFGLYVAPASNTHKRKLLTNPIKEIKKIFSQLRKQGDKESIDDIKLLYRKYFEGVMGFNDLEL